MNKKLTIINIALVDMKVTMENLYFMESEIFLLTDWENEILFGMKDIW